MRVGHGWDVHKLKEGRPFVLGGVTIPHLKGPVGHSDGDVLLHALTDALLGAAALGDIGTHFPDTDARWKGADSSRLLVLAAGLVLKAGFRPVNVDVTVLLQEPKLGPHREAIVSRVASLLGLGEDRVNVKAKTYEKLGPVGTGEAIECHAVVLLEETSSD